MLFKVYPFWIRRCCNLKQFAFLDAFMLQNFLFSLITDLRLYSNTQVFLNKVQAMLRIALCYTLLTGAQQCTTKWKYNTESEGSNAIDIILVKYQDSK